MASTPLIDQVRVGMAVYSSEGKRLGKVRHVHIRETEVYLEVASEKALWKFWQLELKPLFLPPSVVAPVAGQRVTLHMDAKTAKACTWKPAWIAAESVGDYVGRLGVG